MRPVLRPWLIFLLGLPVVVAPWLVVSQGHGAAAPQPMACWSVDDLRRGMRGHGRTVMQGTEIETFQVELLGVLRNTSPGRDLVLARLSGLGLERTGVIAGMSGSPVYIEGKLVGAVAYAWPFGKEPIAGITPYCQMSSVVQAVERRDPAAEPRAVRLQLDDPVRVNGTTFERITVAQSAEGQPSGDDLYLVPLRTPLMATGFTPRSLELLQQRTRKLGLVPMTGGSAGRVAEADRTVGLEPGGPLAVALIAGDFDLSGIGTVTHVEGPRVLGWGHPFMSLGACELPMYTGYIHTVYPRQTVSFKMGSPLREVGVMHADVATCIGGELGRKADMLPMSIRVAVGRNEARDYRVRVARHNGMIPTLVYTALTNAVDLEGELPDELTARMRARIEIAGHAPLVLEDTFSGFSGGRAPNVLYSHVGLTVAQALSNGFKDVRIERIDCDTRIEPGRTTAEIEAVEVDATEYRPGETVTASAWVRLYKGERRRVRVAITLPVDLPDGLYTATVSDDVTRARADLRANPMLYNPASSEQVVEGLRLMFGARRTSLAMRLPTGTHGVAAAGKGLPQLPGSMVQILSNGRRSGAMPIGRAVVARTDTEWVILGQETVTFEVRRAGGSVRASE
ncbi:MAG: SpoIVB peptidase S55 domain-containing protein [Gemmataceae bacterium]